MRGGQRVDVVVGVVAGDIVRQRHQAEKLLAVFVDQVGGQPVAGQWASAVILAARRRVVDRKRGPGVADGLRKVARPFQRRGDGQRPVAAAVLGVLVLFGGEEEQLVLGRVPVLRDEDRAAQRKSIGVVAIGALADSPVGRGAVGIPDAGVQAFVADEDIARTVEFLGAAFGHHLDGRAAGVAHRCRSAVGDYLDLGDCVHIDPGGAAHVHAAVHVADTEPAIPSK